MAFSAFVSWPSAPLTESLVRIALAGLPSPPALISDLSERTTHLLQWSTYDALDHNLILSEAGCVLASSYTIRKALIRKHFLHRCIQSYVTKYKNSPLTHSVPRTWDLDISFVDELVEMWSDELWDLGDELRNTDKWWILKPGMADRGMGIRLFNSKESLHEIFEKFEGRSDDGSISGSENDTDVVTSQLRHFVIQEYLSNPVLIDPFEAPLSHTERKPALVDLNGHKFHLRAYCVASGALTLYLFPRILALFSSDAYSHPSSTENTSEIDLTPHLTNTSLQRHRGEQGVRLFDELVGCHILSRTPPNHTSGDAVMTLKDVQSVISQISDTLAETFRAALQSPVHFQPLPNAFELYGVDFLITHPDCRTYLNGDEPRFQVNLLEINSEPAIELTGPRLTWILEELFVAINHVCVEPFFKKQKQSQNDKWEVGETKYCLRKCLEVRLRGMDV